MKRVPLIALSLILLSLSAIVFSATVRADQSVSVYIRDPFNPANGAKGLSSGGYWVGEIPITVSDGSLTSRTVSYCIDFDLPIYIGAMYPATLAPASDNIEWQAVSYVLSWNYPATNNQAAATQVAIWRLLNETRGTDYFVEPWLNPDIDAAGDALATQAYGRDVVRQDDQFSWVSPVSTNMSATPANPGETVTFTAQLTKADGTPRPNVRVIFNATLTIEGQTQQLDPTYITPAEALTDSQGNAQVHITVPPDTPLGATLAVKASTKSLWPQRYIDISNPSMQDLIGIGDTFQLTLSTDVCVLAYITVLPESSFGTLAGLGAFAAGFAVWIKIRRKK